MKKRDLILILFLLAAANNSIVIADITTGLDEQAQLPFWQWRSPHLQIRLVQRLPDQTRAYFVARGFTSQEAEKIAQSCVFQTIYKNTSTPEAKLTIQYDLTEWQVTQNGKGSPIKTRETWRKEWQSQNVRQSAIIAFQWSLLPTQQSYQAADYNWGMMIFDLPPGSLFDLNLKWRENNVIQNASIPKIQCAPDIDLAPVTPE